MNDDRDIERENGRSTMHGKVGTDFCYRNDRPSYTTIVGHDVPKCVIK